MYPTTVEKMKIYLNTACYDQQASVGLTKFKRQQLMLILVSTCNLWVNIVLPGGFIIGEQNFNYTEMHYIFISDDTDFLNHHICIRSGLCGYFNINNYSRCHLRQKKEENGGR